MSKASRVQFTVEDFGDDASQVTTLIGFEPTTVTICGFSSLPKRTTWLLEVPEPIPSEIAEHVAALVRLLEQHSEGVRKVARLFQTRISIAIDDRDWICPEDTNGPRFANFDLPAHLIAAVAMLEVGLNTQVWCGLAEEMTAGAPSCD